MKPHARGVGRHQSGETLIELVIAIAITGLVVGGVLGGLQAGVGVGHLARIELDTQNVLVSVAESIKEAGFVPCATGPAAYAAQTQPVPAGYNAAVVTVTYWSGPPTNTFTPTCPATDQLQRLDLVVTGTAGPARFTQARRLELLKRAPT